MNHLSRAATAAAVLCLVAAVPACSTKAADTKAVVTGTDDGCKADPDILEAGTIAFEFTNRAAKVNELYVVNANGDVMGEVENVTTGATRTITADLTKGAYKVRCKPGMTGSGVESGFTVTGDGGTQQAAVSRTATFDAIDFTYENLDVAGIAAGDTLRFEMTNHGTQPHEFEVLDPSGEALGEVAAMEPGASGGATITFTQPGQYTYHCVLVDPATNKKHSELGMIGTFEVAGTK